MMISDDFEEQQEHNSLFDQVDEDDDDSDELCENCGDDSDVRATETPVGKQSLCTECRQAHSAFDEEVGGESQDALAAR